MSEPGVIDTVRVGSHGVRVCTGAASDVGLVREVNEDAHVAVAPVWAVADGMGGHDGGDIASRFVAEEFARLAGAGYVVTRAEDAVSQTLRRCQRRLLEYGDTHRGSDGGRWQGGTTAVAAVLAQGDEGPRWLLANLGDSRAYRVGTDGLVRVSTDHSVVQELVDAGMLTEVEAAFHPERHIVTRALGGPDPVDPDFFRLTFDEAPRVVLCSDGLTGMLDDAQVAAILDDHPDAQPAADALVAAALEAGGIDNATVVVVDVLGHGDREAP